MLISGINSCIKGMRVKRKMVPGKMDSVKLYATDSALSSISSLVSLDKKIEMTS
jgi:hypothetical protein